MIMCFTQTGKIYVANISTNVFEISENTCLQRCWDDGGYLENFLQISYDQTFKWGALSEHILPKIVLSQPH
jgi:hypothetical protein